MDDFRDSRIFKLIGQLTKEQRGHFRKWLSSPIVIGQNSRRTILVQYFDSLLHVQTRSRAFSEATMFRNVFPDPDKPFNQNYFRTLSSEMVNQYFDFLTWVQFQSSPYQTDFHRLSAFVENGFPKEFEKKKDKLKKIVRNSPPIGDGWMQYNFQVSHLESIHLSSAQKRKGEAEFGGTLKALDEYYDYERLKLYCRAKNQELTLGSISPATVDQDWVRSKLTSDSQQIRIYALIYLTLTAPEEEEHFFTLKALLEKSREKYQHGILLEWYQYLLNYCGRRVNDGKSRFLQQTCFLYESLIEKGLILDKEGRLHINSFKNIATIYAELAGENGDHQRLKTFLDSFGKQLQGNEEARDVVNLFGKSLLDLITKDYNSAIVGFNDVMASKTLIDWFFLMACRVFTIQAVFERNEDTDDESLIYHIKASEQFIKYHRKNISKTHQGRFTNFLKATRLLQERRVLSKGIKKEAKLEKLREYLLNEEFIVSKSWLLKQVNIAIGNN